MLIDSEIINFDLLKFYIVDKILSSIVKDQKNEGKFNQFK